MSEKERELIERLDEMIEGGMGITKEWSNMWNQSLRYFFSDQLQGQPKMERWQWVVVNYIWPSAMQELAKLSKNDPSIVVNPWSDDDANYAEMWQSALNWQWRKGINDHGMRLEQIAAILDGKLFGYSVSKVYWDPKCYWDGEQQAWVGDVKHRLWNPTEFWADGEEKVEDGNVGSRRWVELEWAQSRWPKLASQIEAKAQGRREENWFPVSGSDIIYGSNAIPVVGTTGTGKRDDSSPELDRRSNMLIDLIGRRSM